MKVIYRRPNRRIKTRLVGIINMFLPPAPKLRSNTSSHALKAFSCGLKLAKKVADKNMASNKIYISDILPFAFLAKGGWVKIPVPGLLKSGIQKISLIYGNIFYQLSNHLYHDKIWYFEFYTLQVWPWKGQIWNSRTVSLRFSRLFVYLHFRFVIIFTCWLCL